MVALAEGALAVSAVAGAVAARREVRDVDPLALEPRHVIVAVAGRDPLADDEPLRLAAAALLCPHRLLGLARELDAPRRVVPVAEAEARLLVAADGLATRGEDVVALEVEEVPVAMRLRLDEADLAIHRIRRGRAIRAAHELLDRHRRGALVGSAADEKHGPASVVLDRGEEREAPGAAGLVYRQRARRRLDEIGENIGRALPRASTAGDEQNDESSLQAHRPIYPRKRLQVPRRSRRARRPRSGGG